MSFTQLVLNFTDVFPNFLMAFLYRKKGQAVLTEFIHGKLPVPPLALCEQGPQFPKGMALLGLRSGDQV